jgi:hypothetical protein
MTSDLLDTMRARLADAESDAQRLRDAISVMEGGSGIAATPRRRESTKEPVVAEPEPKKVVPLGKLISALKTEPGQSASRLAKDSGGNQPAILSLLKEAELSGSVRREGERRGTVWFVVNTDESKAVAKAAAEDEVAAKAAEIETRMKTPRRRAPLTRQKATSTSSKSVKDEQPAQAMASDQKVSEPNTELTTDKDASAETSAPPAS